jgi:metal-responsive CopG/Arc/MetJ family transcriptional regulator
METLNKKTTVSASVPTRVLHQLDEYAEKTGLSRSRLVEQGLRYLFGSRDGNEWLEKMVARHAEDQV